MTIKDFEELLKKNNIDLGCEINENMTVSELGIDSFDVTLLSFEIEKLAGKELKLTLNDTIEDILKKVNHE